MATLRVPAARCRRGSHRGRDRPLEGQARRRRDRQPGARRDRDRQVARRAAVAVRRHRHRAARDEGATVEVGTPIIRVDSAGGTIELQAPANDGDVFGTVADSAIVGVQHEEAPASAADAVAEKSGAVLVGYGSKGGHGVHAPPPARRAARSRRERPAPRCRPAAAVPGHREAADPQAREGPRRRPRDRAAPPGSRARSRATT